MAVQIILKNSAVKDKNPTANQLANGEIALNYFSTGPYLSAKDTDGTVWRIGGVTVAADAPGSPSAGTFWYSTATNSLNIFANGAWRSVGSGGGGGGGGAVDQVIGGSGITISPAGGTGIVTVNASVGAGVEIDGDAIAIDLAANRGLEFVSGELAGKIATSSALGVVSVDGSTITVDADGQISANTAGSQDLSITGQTETKLDLNISGGDGVTFAIATSDLAGLMSGDDKEKLDNLSNPLAYQGTVDLTGTDTPDSPENGYTYANTGDGTVSATWVSISTLTNGAAVTPGDLVVYNGTEYTYIPTGTSGGTGTTNLNYTAATDKGTVTSDTGTDAEIPLAISEGNAGLFTGAEKKKLADLPSDAQKNVQSDWDQATDTADDYIKNKPTLPTDFDFLPLAGGTMTGTVVDTVRTIQAGAFDLSTGNIWTCGGIDVPNPTETEAGVSGLIFFTDEPTGWGSNFEFPGGTQISPEAQSIVPFYVRAENQIMIGSPTNDIK